jgi:DNA-binding IclR family transcriptional regulator
MQHACTVSVSMHACMQSLMNKTKSSIIVDRPSSYWRSHPMEIWSAVGGRFPSTSSSMGHFFGAAAGSVGGADVMSIQDAVGNTRADGTGALLREGAAALLNSMTRAGFPYTTEQVRDAFAAAAAAGSDGAAAAQAAAFRKANEGKA